MEKYRLFGKMLKTNRKKDIKNPHIHDNPRSTFSRDIFPATKAPIAIPMAVDKKRYPPPTSLKCKDCIAKGMVFNCTNPPINKKNPLAKIEGRRNFLI